MRVTGGRSKGQHLSTLKGMKIRPSSDKIRETIFNIIGQNIEGLKVLDLFAGTGSLGIEALSRGADLGLFIDNSRQSIKLIKKNLLICGYEHSGFVIKKDLRTGLPREHSIFEKKIDLVFIDPPYGKGLIPRMLKAIHERDILSSDSIVIAESSKEDILPGVLGGLHLKDTRIYGETKIDVYILRGKNEH